MEDKEIDLSNFLKTVDLSFLDSISFYNPDNQIKKLSSKVYDAYMRYLEEMKSLEEIGFYDSFFELLKAKNIIDSHNLPANNLLSFMISTMNSSEVSRILNITSERKLTNEDVIILNKNILDLNFNADISPSFRQTDNLVVGIKRKDGTRTFHYMPINHESIPMALETILKYFHDTSKEDRENLFIKPAIIQGLVVGIQLFEDGNSRLSSLLGNTKLYLMSKSLIDEDLKSPALYMDKSNFSCKTRYRYIIRDLVLFNDDKVWNTWLQFYLKMAQRQITTNSSILKKYLRK